jgi:hypothetical protein
VPPHTAKIAVLAAALSACGEAPDGEGPMKVDPTEAASDGAESDGPALPPEIPGHATETCRTAWTVDPGLHHGTLRDRAEDLEGACGHGGPDTFLRIAIPYRADLWVEAEGVGFVPHVGVLPGTCLEAWGYLSLGCSTGAGVWIPDLPGGAAPILSIGYPDFDPATDAVALGGPDPLDFRVRTELRRVLEAGERCEPAALGRCGSPTVCLPGFDGISRCTALPGDTCASALPVAVPLGISTVTIPGSALHSDAHEHSCGGARHPEAVYALALEALPLGGTLRVSTAAPVGLALRGADCAPTGELACATAGPAGSEIVVDLPASSGSSFLLFVELPLPDPAAPGGTNDPDPGEEAPIALLVALSTG